MTVGIYCYYEISSTHLHKRKWIIQELSCAATNLCRFKLFTKCSRGITLLMHSLCCYPYKCSPYLCNRPLRSSLSYSYHTQLLYLDCQLFLISSSNLTNITACLSCYFQVVICFFCLSSYLIENTVHPHYQNQWLICTNIFTWSAHNFCPNYIKLDCGLLCW